MLWEHDDDDNGGGIGARTTTMRRRAAMMTNEDSAIVRGAPPFLGDNNDIDDMDKDSYVKGGRAVALPSALATRHDHGEGERIGRF